MTSGRLPLTVISGYLGAGKTTLINRLLAEAHGLRLLVMVNDFGAINIDAALLASATEDTLTLSNGCVCCTMGADLFMAVGDVLDRDVLPDHLIIEASGIADPAKIAQVAQAEPDLIYGGIVTVVDAANYVALADDPQIGPQVALQVAVADVICVSKTSGDDAALALKLSIQSGAQIIDLHYISDLSPAIFGLTPQKLATAPWSGHPAYVAWHHSGEEVFAHEALLDKMNARPGGLFRFKGFVGCDAQSAWEVHGVGPSISLKSLKSPRKTQVVGIGLAGRITQEDMSAWWLA